MMMMMMMMIIDDDDDDDYDDDYDDDWWVCLASSLALINVSNDDYDNSDDDGDIGIGSDDGNGYVVALSSSFFLVHQLESLEVPKYPFFTVFDKSVTNQQSNRWTDGQGLL